MFWIKLLSKFLRFLISFHAILSFKTCKCYDIWAYVCLRNSEVQTPTHFCIQLFYIEGKNWNAVFPRLRLYVKVVFWTHEETSNYCLKIICTLRLHVLEALYGMHIWHSELSTRLLFESISFLFFFLLYLRD